MLSALTSSPSSGRQVVLVENMAVLYSSQETLKYTIRTMCSIGMELQWMISVRYSRRWRISKLVSSEAVSILPDGKTSISA